MQCQRERIIMITEDYVSFETAKLLKEKGFDEGCTRYWYKGKLVFSGHEIWNRELDNYYEDKAWTAPTLQMAMKWLREVHGLHFWIAHKLKQNKGLPWYYEIHNIETGTVVKIGDVVCGSYEVACEAAIKYCLEKLI